MNPVNSNPSTDGNSFAYPDFNLNGSSPAPADPANSSTSPSTDTSSISQLPTETQPIVSKPMDLDQPISSGGGAYDDSASAPATLGSGEIDASKSSGGSNPLKSLAQKLSGLSGGMIEVVEDETDESSTQSEMSAPATQVASDSNTDLPAADTSTTEPDFSKPGLSEMTEVESGESPTDQLHNNAPNPPFDPLNSMSSTTSDNPLEENDSTEPTDLSLESEESLSADLGGSEISGGITAESTTDVANDSVAPTVSTEFGQVLDPANPPLSATETPSFDTTSTERDEQNFSQTDPNESNATDIGNNPSDPTNEFSFTQMPMVDPPGVSVATASPPSDTTSSETAPTFEFQQNSVDQLAETVDNTDMTQPEPAVNTMDTDMGVNPATVAQPVAETPIESPAESLAPTGPTVAELAAESNPQSKLARYPYTIDQLLDIVVERDASDLHITVGYPAMIRVDGDLIKVTDAIVEAEHAPELILPVLPEQKKELLEVNREVDLAYAHNQDARFRINTYYQQQTLAGAFRLIPNIIRSIDDLKLPPVYHQLAKLRQGLVLVTGPTGSGKSTTLAAIIQQINTNRPDHIITIEDPVEYVFPKGMAMVDQRELHEDTHSWEIALKSAMRQDPDVILIGEMRDYETISAAITLAETGHLVFATLHTNSAAQTLDRIVDVFPEHQQAQIRSQVSSTIEAVVAQRLIPIESGGRRAVSEIMIATPAIRNLIREAKTHQIDNVIRTSADIGMISLEHSLVKLVRDNVITMERAQEYAVHPEEVVRLLKS